MVICWYMRDVLPGFYQHVITLTWGNNKLEHVYKDQRNHPPPQRGLSNHISIMLVPAFCPLFQGSQPTATTSAGYKYKVGSVVKTYIQGSNLYLVISPTMPQRDLCGWPCRGSKPAKLPVVTTFQGWFCRKPTAGGLLSVLNTKVVKRVLMVHVKVSLMPPIVLKQQLRRWDGWLVD